MSQWRSFIKILRSSKSKVPDGVEVFEVYGSLFFGAVDQFTESIRQIEKKPKVFIPAFLANFMEFST